MGYYSEIIIETEIKKEYIKQVQNMIEDAKKIPHEKRDYVNWHMALMILHNDGEFEFDESYQKWYGDQEWIKKIGLFCEPGKITWTGEDGDKWGYEITDNGQIYFLEWVTKRGELFYSLEMAL